MRTYHQIMKKLAERVQNYKEFEKQAIRWLRFYHVPTVWTKVDLRHFYDDVKLR